MFSTEYNGYSKTEVDRYIAKLKREHEASLMEEKLKVLESEKRLLDFKNKSYDLESREKNIMSALDMFKKYQDEGSRNIDALRIEQLKVVYQQMKIAIEELKILYPGIDNNSGIKKVLQDVSSILEQITASENAPYIAPVKTENDSMRMLLNKMQGYRKVQDTPKAEAPKEVRIERNGEIKNQIKPVCEMTIEEGENYDNLVDKFLSTKPEEPQSKTMKIQSSGFDLKEAINPKDDLAEIMKAFDFYGGNEE